MTHPAPTQYVQSGDISIAYQILGAGPSGLIVAGGTFRISTWPGRAIVRCLGAGLPAEGVDLTTWMR